MLNCGKAQKQNVFSNDSAGKFLFKNVSLSSSQIKVYERLQINMQLDATPQNPFDADEIRVDVQVKCPERRDEWSAPAFWYQDFQAPISSATVASSPSSALESKGDPHWQARLSFPKPGRYQLTFTARDGRGSSTTGPITISVAQADAAGMIRCHPKDHRYFASDRGETWFPVGFNTCWGELNGLKRGYLAYAELFERMDKNGCNLGRLWLAPSWTDLSMRNKETGFDRINLANAWRLDQVLREAEARDIRLMMCIESFNILLPEKISALGTYEKEPDCQANGGPIRKPVEFFTNTASQKAFRNRLRYLVARYGYSPSVFAWELWNEADLMDGYDPKIVRAWHKEMTQCLRSLDPWRHLITTSLSRAPGDPELDALPDVDFIQSHSYSSRDPVADFERNHLQNKAALNKPWLVGEFSVTPASGEDSALLDPSGIHLRQALYASVGQMQAGTPMSWWWDSYIETRNLYPLYRGFSKWIAGFDFAAQAAQPIQARVAMEGEPLQGATSQSAINLRPSRGQYFSPVHIVPSAESWKAGAPEAPNRPAQVLIGQNGAVSGNLPLSRILHGWEAHPDWHNPVIFYLNAPQATVFGIEVGDVSGYGGAYLRVWVDRLAAGVWDFFDADGKETTDTLTQYRGVYRVAVPAGQRAVIVENAGVDWLQVKNYFFQDAASPASAPLKVWGVQGRDRALAWIMNTGYSWHTALNGYAPPVRRNARIILDKLPAGLWTVEFWDTQKGQAIKSAEYRVNEGESLAIPLPDIASDMALRLSLAPLKSQDQ